MFLIYLISYGCNGGALVFLGGAEASASPSFALPMFIMIKKIIILHLFLGGYAHGVNIFFLRDNFLNIWWLNVQWFLLPRGGTV